MYMESYTYLKGQDLWVIEYGSEAVPPEDPMELKKWRVMAGKAMFAVRITVEEEMFRVYHTSEDTKRSMGRGTFSALS